MDLLLKTHSSALGDIVFVTAVRNKFVRGHSILEELCDCSYMQPRPYSEKSSHRIRRIECSVSQRGKGQEMALSGQRQGGQGP